MLTTLKLIAILTGFGMAPKAAAGLADDVMVVAGSEPALWSDDKRGEKTARLLATWAFMESSGRSDITGDVGASCGVMQLAALARQGHSCAEIRKDRVLGLRLGLRFMHFCAKKCGSLEKGLVAYASGSCNAMGLDGLVTKRLKRAGIE